MVSFLTCPVLVKFPALSGDHGLGQEAGNSEVPARGRKNSIDVGHRPYNYRCCILILLDLLKNMVKMLTPELYIVYFRPQFSSTCRSGKLF